MSRCRRRSLCSVGSRRSPNNVANMNTVGYRADGVTFDAQVAKAGDNHVSYVDAGRRLHFSPRRPADRRPAIRSTSPSRATAGSPSTPDGDGLHPRRPLEHRRDRRRSTSTARRCSTPAARRSSSIPGRRRRSISGDGMITQNGRQTGAIGLFLLDARRQADARRQFRLHFGQARRRRCSTSRSNGVVAGRGRRRQRRSRSRR